MDMLHSVGSVSRQTVTDLVEQGAPAFDAAVPVLARLPKAEVAGREVRSIHCPAGDCKAICARQAIAMQSAARGLPHEGRVRLANGPPDCLLVRLTPACKDLSGFDFAAGGINEATVRQLHRGAFMDGAQNVVPTGGPGTGKTHVATAPGVQAVEHHRRKVRFFSTVELVNTLEQEKARAKAGQLAESLTRLDLVILDKPGYLPFSTSGSALLSHRPSKLSGRTSVVISTNPSFSERATVFGDPKMTTALPDRLTHRRHILETGNDSFRFRAGSAAAARKTKEDTHAATKA